MGTDSMNRMMYKNYSNNPVEEVNHWKTSRDDAYYSSELSALSNAADFQAVILSGFVTGNNTGTGIDPNDARIVLGEDTANKYFEITIFPLPPVSSGFIDIRQFDNFDDINRGISMATTLYRARSEHSYEEIKGSKLPFGHVVTCYYEGGDMSKLRFRSVSNPNPDTSFLTLYTLAGVQGPRDLFRSNNSIVDILGPPQGDTGLVSTNQRNTRKTTDIKYIVIHYSAAGRKTKSVLSYENRATKWGYHYMVDLDGSYLTTCPEDKVIWHSGGNKIVGNWNSVGIMLINDGYHRPPEKSFPKSRFPVKAKYPNNKSKEGMWEAYNNTMMVTLVELVTGICKRYGLNPDTAIVGHSDIQSNKSDPGPAFPMQDVKDQVRARML